MKRVAKQIVEQWDNHDKYRQVAGESGEPVGYLWENAK